MSSSHGGKKMWCVGELDEKYIFNMEDVLKTYERPLSKSEPVVCVDEKPAVLHEDTRPPIPMQPGQVTRRDYEYKRCGTANVFCRIEPKAGLHFTEVTPPARRLSLPIFFWRLPSTIAPPTPSIWSSTT